MLKQRLLTALILVPLVVWGILALPVEWLALALGLVVLLGSWEWSRIAGLQQAAPRFLISLIFAVCLAGTFWLLDREPAAPWWILLIAFIGWLLQCGLVVAYPKGQSLWHPLSIRLIAGLIVLLPAWAAIIYLQGQPGFGVSYVLFLLFLTWFADSAAYFGGRAFGRRKLLINVSPGKTWEGVFSALVVVAAFALVTGPLLDVAAEHLAWFVGLSLLTVLFSILGDLNESMYKRQAGLKDSGHTLPGHGGILDRIDSLTAAAPIFVLGLMSSGIAGPWQPL